MLVHVAPDRRLYVDVEGCGLVPDGARMRDKPTLLLLHGGPGFDHSGFKPAFSALADIAQVVYVDHRGHGRSDAAPRDEWTLDTWADDVVRLCDALGIVRPVVLGQSFGGFVAQRYLARHPDHPARVILSSTSHHMGLQRKLAMFERLGGTAARDAAQAFWSRPDARNWAVYDERCMPLYNTVRREGGVQARQRQRRQLDILLHFVAGEKQALDLRPGLAAVRCPVLVMAGAQDPVCPLADAEEIAAAIPAPWGRLSVFAGSGHGTWRDEPEAAFAVIREFVAAA